MCYELGHGHFRVGQRLKTFFALGNYICALSEVCTGMRFQMTLLFLQLENRSACAPERDDSTAIPTLTEEPIRSIRKYKSKRSYGLER